MWWSSFQTPYIGMALSFSPLLTLELPRFRGSTPAFVTRLSLVTFLAVSPATLPNGVVGAPYGQAITAAGGAAPYTFAVSSGALPPASP